MATKNFDAVIIGSGQAGTPLAFALAGEGKRTALVEAKHLGGSCVNVGCTPTKTFISSARVRHVLGRAHDYGIELNGDSAVDMPAVGARVNDMRIRFRSGIESGADSTERLEVFYGTGRVAAQNTVVVNGRDGASTTLSAPQIFIDTGTRPVVPPIEGLAAVPYLTNESILDLDELPEHLFVLGGGYIGVEFAQAYRRLGSRVTIVQRAGALLPREDEEVRQALHAVLEDEGVRVLTASALERVTPQGAGFTAEVVSSAGAETLSASHLLLATGRAPNTDGLGLEELGISLDKRGYIQVDAQLNTGVQGIWALGDVKGGPAFTHTSYDDFRILQRALAGRPGPGTDERLLAYTVFTDPQLARVGMSEREARAAGYDVAAAAIPMTRVARALEVGETRGLMKAVVDRRSERILGFAMVGLEAGEVAGAVQVAILTGAPYTLLRDTPFAHPTLVESLNNLFGGVTL